MSNPNGGSPSQHEPQDGQPTHDLDFSKPKDVILEGTDEDFVERYVSDTLVRALDKLIPDDSIDKVLQDVKVDAMARTLKEESDSRRGSVRSAILPLSWFLANSFGSGASESPEIHRYVVKYDPAGNPTCSALQPRGRTTHHRIPRKLIASFWVGGIVGSLVPAAFLAFSGAVSRYQTVWTVAFAMGVAIAAIGVAMLTLFTLRTISAMDSVEVRLTSDEGRVEVLKTRQRVGRSTIVFPYGKPKRPPSRNHAANDVAPSTLDPQPNDVK